MVLDAECPICKGEGTPIKVGPVCTECGAALNQIKVSLHHDGAGRLISGAIIGGQQGTNWPCGHQAPAATAYITCVCNGTGKVSITALV